MVPQPFAAPCTSMVTLTSSPALTSRGMIPESLRDPVSCHFCQPARVTLPSSLTKLANINSLRFYVTAYNVFTITGYDGFDPESDCIRSTALTPNVDYSGYPRSRQFVVGLNLNF